MDFYSFFRPFPGGCIFSRFLHTQITNLSQIASHYLWACRLGAFFLPSVAVRDPPGADSAGWIRSPYKWKAPLRAGL